MSKETFKPSEYQLGIFKFITDGIGNAVINAVAGSGKTTTLLKSLGLIPKDKEVILLAFNRGIKIEIDERVKELKIDNVIVNTCHGLGNQVISSAFKMSPSIDNFKYRKLFKTVTGFAATGDSELIDILNLEEDILNDIKHFDVNWDDVDDKYEFQKRVIKLVDLGRLYLDTTEESMLAISKRYSISLDSNEAKLASILVNIGNEQLDVIDFTDMVYLPNQLNLEVPKYDFTFIDECQDLNTAQRELMLKTLGKDSRFIAVGDKNQAIYGFAGADSESFEKLVDLPDTTLLPLSVSYRCGHNIVKMVKDIVAEIKPFKGNPRGKVINDGTVKDIKDGDMVLCRNTYPLVKLCLQFLKEGSKATIMGGEIGKSLIKLITDTNKTDMGEVFDKLYHNLELTLNRIMSSEGCTTVEGKENQEYVNNEERIQVIEAIFEGGDTSDTVCGKLRDIFDDSEKAGIILSTVHRAKGMENDRVFIIQPETMPSPYAILPWELEQEDNLKYVAYTRAISRLTLVRDFDAYKSRAEESFEDKVKKVKPSKHVGAIGDRYDLVGKIVEIREIEKYKTTVCVIEDNDGNIFEKWGEIPHYILKSKIQKASVGTLISANVEITKHVEFSGLKKNGIKGMKVLK